MSAEKCNVIDISYIEDLRNSKIIIYGAGIYGNKLYTYLKLKQLDGNITSFAVSKREQNPYVIDDVPVKEIEELKDELASCTVLVAIGATHIDEVIDLLQNYAIESLYSITKEVIEKISEEIYEKMKLFPLEQNKLFISCSEGMGYRCNCKYIVERLMADHAPVKIVWAVENRYEEDMPEKIKKVEPFTYEYYKELYTSKICITNSESWLFGKKKAGQYYINTWHGYGPFKTMKADFPVNKDRLDEIREISSKYDLFLTGSTFYSQVYRDSFLYEGEIYECGAPRNDVFFTDNGIKEMIYKKFEIPSHKKILLYAPTFRPGMELSFDQYDLDMDEVLKALNAKFHGEYILMYRFHYYLRKLEQCRNYYKDGIDVTCYLDTQELLVAADIVITDYSSLMWDFSLQRKPVFLYQNDEKEYTDHRGFYCPVSQWPYPKAHSQEELIHQIQHFDNEKYIRDLNAFLEKYGSCDHGDASRKAAEKIMKVVNGAG